MRQGRLLGCAKAVLSYGMHLTCGVGRQPLVAPLRVLFRMLGLFGVLVVPDLAELGAESAQLHERLAELATESTQVRERFERLAAMCYVDRYTDLRRAFCVSDGACDWKRVRDHWRKHGAKEGRLFGCEAANSTATPGPSGWCATHAHLHESSSGHHHKTRTRGKKKTEVWRAAGGEKVTVETIMDHVDASLAADDVLYRVDVPSDSNLLAVLAVRAGQPRSALAYSNEWLSLLRQPYYDAASSRERWHPVYAHQVDLYSTLATCDASAAAAVDAVVVPLVTSFSRGTVHGFTGFWLILRAWVEREATAPTNRTLLVYAESDSGMLDVVRAAAASGVVDASRLLLLERGVTYRFRRLELLPNPSHSYWLDAVSSGLVSDFVHRHFVREPNADAAAPDRDRPRTRTVAILKTHAGQSKEGVLCPNIVGAILRAARRDPTPTPTRLARVLRPSLGRWRPSRAPRRSPRREPP